MSKGKGLTTTERLKEYCNNSLKVTLWAKQDKGKAKKTRVFISELKLCFGFAGLKPGGKRDRTQLGVGISRVEDGSQK